MAISRESTHAERSVNAGGNLASILTETAQGHGDRTALKLDEIELSYAQLEEASARVAGLVRAIP